MQVLLDAKVDCELLEGAFVEVHHAVFRRAAGHLKRKMTICLRELRKKFDREAVLDAFVNLICSSFVDQLVEKVFEAILVRGAQVWLRPSMEDRLSNVAIVPAFVEPVFKLLGAEVGARVFWVKVLQIQALRHVVLRQHLCELVRSRSRSQRNKNAEAW